MNKNIEQIKEAAPEAADQEHVKALASDLDRAQLLRNVMESEGGQLLTDALRDDCRNILSAILKEVEHPLVAKLEAHLNLLTTLSSAKDREKNIQKVLDEEIYRITH